MSAVMMGTEEEIERTRRAVSTRGGRCGGVGVPDRVSRDTLTSRVLLAPPPLSPLIHFGSVVSTTLAP